MAGGGGEADVPGPAPERDWMALLLRALEPFRSEAAAFRVLLATIGVFGTLVVVVVLVRALG